MTTSNGKAETVIKNANIMTMDTSHPRAEAVAMTHGRFAGVGSNEDIEGLIGPDTKIIDAGGKTVLPGFIDGHIHVLSSGVKHVNMADCDVRTLKEVQAGLKERAAKTPAGGWVQGFKFDDTKTDRMASNDGRHLYKEDLDAVTTDHPMMVAHRGGHVFYMNSAGLEAGGYNDESQDPPGGRLGRDPDTGKLNGIVYERAIDHIRFGLIPVDTDEIRREGLRTICKMLNE
ncbi:MAG: amidohydrolase family protein, partial [Dehalococcoidia bacterium]|nr:amidohydrolase family protein [Dehalococcoidia bacterium]